MEPTLEQFREIFSEFNSISNTKVNYYMDLAKGKVGKNAFGDCYAQAVYLMTAHDLVMSNPDRASSAEKASEKVGDLAISYNTSTTGDDLDAYLRQTQYGNQFLNLRNSKVITMSIVDC